MPRPRSLAPLALPLGLVAAVLGCERLAGVDGSFRQLPDGASGSSPSEAGRGGAGQGEQQGSAGTTNNGQSGTAGAGTGGSPAMGAGGSGGAPPAPVEFLALVSGQANVRQLVADGETLYWVSAGTEAGSFADGAVRACAVTGCEDNPRDIATGQLKPEFIGVADPNAGALPDSVPWSRQVYWTNTLGGTVLSCAKTGCTQPSLIAENQTNPRGVNVSSSASGPSGAAGEVHIYWAIGGDGGTTPAQVKRCKLDAAGPCPDPEVLAPDVKPPTALITGQSYIYWISPGTAVNNFTDGEVYRFRKNVDPSPSRPGEERLFAMSRGLHHPVGFELQISQLFIATLGTGPADTDAGVWIAKPLDVDNTPGQVTAHPAAKGSISATVATPETLYWASNGTLYGCAMASCPSSGPVFLKENVGSGPMYVTKGPTDDIVYTVSGTTIVRIRVPHTSTQLPL